MSPDPNPNPNRDNPSNLLDTIILFTRSERCIPIKLLYPLNYWDYHGWGWGLGQGSFYIHEMTIPTSTGIIKRCTQ